MDLNKLCERLHTPFEHFQNTEIGQLQRAVAGLMLNLGAMMPGKSSLFQALVEDMQNSSAVIRQNKVNVHSYFSGNGPTANKLKEHLAVMDWVDQYHNPPVRDFSGQATLSKTTNAQHMKHQLKMFDFNPSDDAALVTEVNEFIQTIRPVLTGRLFLTPNPPLTREPIDFTTLLTGIYGDATVPESLSIILHGTVPDTNGLQVILSIVSGFPASIWYYHPFERLWLVGDWRISFKGVLETLQGEFRVALQDAGVVEREFDFTQEMERLEKQAYSIFDREDKLPQNLFYYRGGLQVQPLDNNPPLGYYARDVESSSVMFPFGEGVHLTFMNTKGKYPSRSKVLCRNLSFNTQTKLDPADIPTKLQEQIVQITSQALGCFDDVICSSS